MGGIPYLWNEVNERITSLAFEELADWFVTVLSRGRTGAVGTHRRCWEWAGGVLMLNLEGEVEDGQRKEKWGVGWVGRGRSLLCGIY